MIKYEENCQLGFSASSAFDDFYYGGGDHTQYDQEQREHYLNHNL